jgi:3-oxoacyl-[acyl-carrier protein] reductase
VTLPPKVLTAADLRVGLTAEFEREIDETDVLGFATSSGDFNPLHVDSDFASGTRYAKRVVHGAFQIGLASALLGMHLPGRDVLLGSVNARFQSPLYFPCRVRVSGEITSWNPSSRSGNVRVTISDLSSLAAVSEITMGFTLQAEKTESAPKKAIALAAKKTISADKKLVLLTGASGGIGAALLRPLSENFSVLALVHRRALLEKCAGMIEISADISSPDWEEKVAAHIGDSPLYGIVHCAWPGLPKGGLLQSDPRLIEQQLAFGTTHVVRLARLLDRHAGSDGGRFVALSSIAGHHKPAFGTGAYSLAKSALEDTVRLLGPELARKKISINSVCPAFVPTGMNSHADDLQLKRERALIPMGRTCETDDIVGAIRYLLSPDASFVSGQSIVLSGAQL